MDKSKQIGLTSCINCSQAYCVRVNSVRKNPLLLECGHSQCENCILNALKADPGVVCNICSHVTKPEKPVPAGDLKRVFPVNIFLVGQMMTHTQKMKAGESMISFKPKTADKKTPLKRDRCIECSQRYEEFKCKQCTTGYCTQCFDVVHKNARSLRVHEKVPLNRVNTTPTPAPVFCQSHPNDKSEYYCRTCETDVCPHCAIDSHSGHNMVRKELENEEHMGELKEAFEEASKIYKRLQFTRKKAVSSASQPAKLDLDLSDLENQVNRHFQCLHGLLQLREGQLLEKIAVARSQTTSSLRDATDEINMYIKNLEELLDTAKEAMKPANLQWIDAKQITKKLSDVQNSPCYLVLSQEDLTKIGEDETENIDNTDGAKVEDFRPQLFLDDSIVSLIKEHCSLVVPGSKKFKLKCEKDLPQDFVIEPIPQTKIDEILYVREPSLQVNAQEVLPKLSVSSICSESDISVSNKFSAIEEELANISFSSRITPSSSKQGSVCADTDVSAKQLTQQSSPLNTSVDSSYSDLTPGTVESVVISHINSPSDFFIQRKGADVQLRITNAQINKLHLNTKNPPTEVLSGGIYLVLYDGDKKWYRAKVVEVIEPQKIHVFYMDFGNEETVPVQRLRNIPTKFALLPVLAVHCELFDCYPQPGPQWSLEAIKLMAAMTKGDSLSMHVMRKQRGLKLEIDLKIFYDFSSLSVREALIFHEFASFAENEKIFMQEIANMLKKGYCFLNNTNFTEGQILDVRVSHVESPSKFYIQKVSGSMNLSQKILNEFYSKKLGMDYTVYAPIIGLPVAVFDSDGQWHRGLIDGLPGGRNVTVRFVDTGATKTMWWDHLKRLENRFLRATTQCIECGLHDIVPVKSEGKWTENVIQAFKKMVIGKNLGATVTNKLDKPCLKLVLYEKSFQSDICINALLVKERLADSTGVSWMQVEYFKQPTKKPSKPKSLFHQIIDKPKFLPAKPKRNRYNEEPSLTPPSSIEGAHRRTPIQSQEGETDVSEDDDDKMGHLRMAVIVRRIVNPENFIVSLNSQEPLFKQLKEEMFEYYTKHFTSSKESSNGTKWEVKNRCAVKRADNFWYRAIIIEIFEDSCKAKLDLKDITVEETFGLDELHILDEKFLSVRDGSFKCHLTGIMAPGGSGSWPSIATETFQEHVQAVSKVYLTQKGSVNVDVDMSVPCELWVRSQVESGALEPVKHKWYTINDYLVSKGLALPVKSELPDTTMSHFVPKTRIKTEEGSSRDSRCTTPSLKTANELTDEEVTPSKEKTLKKKTSKKKEELLQHNMITEWLPPVPLKEMKFVAFPTYVDHDAHIYLQETTSADILQILQTSLLSRFQNSKPMPHDLYWFPGQLCIAQWHHDLKWYRAKVLKVNADNTLQVEMVDYGNVEVCKASDLRKNIYMTQIPVQCHRCSLPNLKPVTHDGNWTIQILDYIHSSVVEKMCYVELIGEVGNYALTTIKPPGGMTLAELLISINYVTYRDSDQEESDESDDSIIIEGEVVEDIVVNQRQVSGKDVALEPANTKEMGQGDADLQSSLTWVELVDQDKEKKREESLQTYKQIVIPESITEFLVEIAAILSPTSVLVQIYPQNERPLAEIKSNFIKLQDMMQIEGPKQPPLKKPYFEGQLCCAQFSVDKSWYRAVVQNVQGEEVTIKFVDYGNVETLQSSDLFELKPEWISVNVQGIQCTLWGIKRCQDASIEECVTLLQQEIFISPLICKIKNRSPLLVELYKSESELVYQRLLDEKLYEMVKLTD